METAGYFFFNRENVFTGINGVTYRETTILIKPHTSPFEGHAHGNR